MKESASNMNVAPVPPTVGIVGGEGRMGKMFGRFFESAGYTVLISDIGTELNPMDIARRCQVIILSLPMEVFPDVVREIGPVIPEDAFLTDLCSLKQTQVACMLENTSCEVVGTHPLFGPGEDSFKGRRVALCPGRGKRWLSWWEGLLRQHGALTYIVSAEEHDKTMAWVQALNHFLLLCLGKALEEDGIDLKQLLSLATPSFERQLDIVSRLSNQDPELYATIQMSNPYTDQALTIFARYRDELYNIVNNKDREAFERLFVEVQEFGKTLLNVKAS